MNRRSPQEKKRLSYARDRRNDYAENDKSSRTSVRLNQRFPHRANRHRARQDLLAAAGVTDLERAVAAEVAMLARRPKSWRKVGDRALGDHVEAVLTRRGAADFADAVSASRLSAVRARRRTRPRRGGGTTWTSQGVTARYW